MTRTTIARALELAGVPGPDAAVVADVLVTADERGIPAHGSACLDAYLERLRSGRIESNPRRSVERESATSLVIDGGNGLGHATAHFAMNRTIEKAASGGAAFCAVRNSNDIGIAGFYAMMALPHDMIGIAATNAARSALPTFGREVLLGGNPLAFAVPANEEPAFVLDFATTKGSYPLGGEGTESGGHKGYGLALLTDILCAVLSGGTPGFELPPLTQERYPGRLSHFFGAIRIDGFRDPLGFKNDMDALIRDHRASEKAPGHTRIYLAGEPEWERSKLTASNTGG